MRMKKTRLFLNKMILKIIIKIKKLGFIDTQTAIRYSINVTCFLGKKE